MHAPHAVDLLTADGHLDCFHIWTTGNNAGINMYGFMCEHVFPSSLVICVEVEMLNTVVAPCFSYPMND